jgi:hypothetical protein
MIGWRRFYNSYPIAYGFWEKIISDIVVAVRVCESRNQSQGLRVEGRPFCYFPSTRRPEHQIYCANPIT